MEFFADEIDIFTDPNSGSSPAATSSSRTRRDGSRPNASSSTSPTAPARFIRRPASCRSAKADRAQFGNQDPDVYFYGDTIEKLGARKYRLTRGGFTTCVQPTPRWEVTSGSVVINLDDYAIARNTLLRVKGVPLLYLPVIYYPIQDDDRATGFLLPTYGSSSLRGQALSNAFFWAIGRSQDATFFHDWFTQAGQGAGAEYRYVAGQGSYGNFRFYRFAQQQTEFTQGGQTSTLPNADDVSVQRQWQPGARAAIRCACQRIDYISNMVTQQLYQQNFYQASNATRTIEAACPASGAASAPARSTFAHRDVQPTDGLRSCTAARRE